MTGPTKSPSLTETRLRRRFEFSDPTQPPATFWYNLLLCSSRVLRVCDLTIGSSLDSFRFDSFRFVLELAGLIDKDTGEAWVACRFQPCRMLTTTISE